MNDDKLTLPIAETFHSVQGEGTWVGTPMHFIRLAGCSVGKHPTAMLRTSAKSVEPFPILGSGKPAWACRTFDGRHFWCDTDFAKYSEATPEKLMTETWEEHICLTGGEPLMHAERDMFSELLTRARERNVLVHIETSGTIMYSPHSGVWITCAPKFGALPEMLAVADEIKILIDGNFHPSSLPSEVLARKNVFLCPVNYLSENDKTNIERCMFWLKRFPSWRMSVQMHKFIGAR